MPRCTCNWCKHLIWDRHLPKRISPSTPFKFPSPHFHSFSLNFTSVSTTSDLKIHQIPESKFKIISESLSVSHMHASGSRNPYSSSPYIIWLSFHSLLFVSGKFHYCFNISSNLVVRSRYGTPIDSSWLIAHVTNHALPRFESRTGSEGSWSFGFPWNDRTYMNISIRMGITQRWDDGPRERKKCKEMISPRRWELNTFFACGWSNKAAIVLVW